MGKNAHILEKLVNFFKIILAKNGVVCYNRCNVIDILEEKRRFCH